jgi:uncharacterized protein
LVDRIGRYHGAVVAFSGGVDSTVVAAAAQRALGPRALAVTAVSPSVSQHQRGWAEACAAEIGIRHRYQTSRETERREYQRNDARRCYFCKQTLYQTLRSVADEEGLEAVLSGTNLDDLGDYRPGLEAGREAAVGTPLCDLGMRKQQVRQLARHWGLSNWDLPAAPCLASRLAYGVEATAARLRRVERAEAWLRRRGLADLRVRVHADELARVEVPAAAMKTLAEPSMAAAVVEALTEIGFAYVTLDLAGLRSGNLNRLIQIETPSKA